MTVPAQSSQSLFVGNGSTTTFTFPWSVDSATNVNVYYIDTTGSQTYLSPTLYTISLNAVAAGQLWSAGGTVTYPLSGSPIANGTFLLVQRAEPYSQSVNVANQTAYPISVQQGLDKLEFQIQQLVSRTGQFRGNWVTNTQYYFGDMVVDGPNGTDTGNIYTCTNGNLSDTWATDLANGDWTLAVNVQSIVNATPSINNNTLFANISGVPASPTSVTLTAFIDSAISNTQGSLLYRNASGWVALAPGTSGYVLTTNGAAANPSWASAGGGGGSGTVTSVSTGSGLTGGPITTSGTVALATIADSSLLANASGGVAVPSATTLSAFIDHAISSTQGSILYRNATSWVALGPGTSGQVLTTAGAAANPSWSSASSGLVLLATTNASGAASVVFNSTYITSTYRKYIVEIDSLFAANGGIAIDLYMTISVNNGSTYVAANYLYAGSWQDTSGTTVHGVSSSGDSHFDLTLATAGISAVSTGVSQLTVKFSNPSNSKYLDVTWDGSCWDNGLLTNINGSGINTNSATAINAIKFVSGNGAALTGTFKLYGLS